MTKPAFVPASAEEVWPSTDAVIAAASAKHKKFLAVDPKTL